MGNMFTSALERKEDDDDDDEEGQVGKNEDGEID